MVQPLGEHNSFIQPPEAPQARVQAPQPLQPFIRFTPLQTALEAAHRQLFICTSTLEQRQVQGRVTLQQHRSALLCEQRLAAELTALQRPISTRFKRQRAAQAQAAAKPQFRTVFIEMLKVQDKEQPTERQRVGIPQFGPPVARVKGRRPTLNSMRCTVLALVLVWGHPATPLLTASIEMLRGLGRLQQTMLCFTSSLNAVQRHHRLVVHQRSSRFTSALERLQGTAQGILQRHASSLPHEPVQVLVQAVQPAPQSGQFLVLSAVSVTVHHRQRFFEGLCEQALNKEQELQNQKDLSGFESSPQMERYLPKAPTKPVPLVGLGKS